MMNRRRRIGRQLRAWVASFGFVAALCALVVATTPVESVSARMRPPVARSGPDFFAPWEAGERMKADKSSSGYHTGREVDWNALGVASRDCGWPVLASAPGTVRNLTHRSYGKYVLIDHGNGWQSLFAHLSDFALPQRAPVDRATVVGYVGTTGASTGCHIHHEQRFRGKRMDVVVHGRKVGDGEVVSSDNGRELPLVGDWEGDGIDDVGLYDAATSTFSFFDASGEAAERCSQRFGTRGDVPVAGDWDGDGVSTVGVYRPSEARFYLTDDAEACGALSARDVVQVQFGSTSVGDRTPVIGDWDGDGLDNVGLYRDSDPEAQRQIARFHLGPDREPHPILPIEELWRVPFGARGDLPVAGDWDGDGDDEVGVWRVVRGEGTFFLDADLSGGIAEFSPIPLGESGDLPLAGNWDDDFEAELGLYVPSSREFSVGFDIEELGG